MNKKKLKERVKYLILRDIDILADILVEAIALYDVKSKELESRWKRLISKGGLLENAVHEEFAQLIKCIKKRS